MHIGRLDQSAEYSIEGPSSKRDRLATTDNEQDLSVKIRSDLKPHNQVAMKDPHSLRHVNYEKRLKNLYLTTLKVRREKKDMIKYNIFAKSTGWSTTREAHQEGE